MKAQENTLNAQPHCCGPFSVDGMLPVQTYLRIILQQFRCFDYMGAVECHNLRCSCKRGSAAVGALSPTHLTGSRGSSVPQKTLTSGIIILGEVKRPVDRRRLKFALPNPGGHVIKQTNKGKLIDALGQEWIYLTVGESIFMLHTYKKDETFNCSLSMCSCSTPFEDGVAPLTVVFTEYCIS
ncbi:STAS domain-containing protein [Artemisia annua]|uniref:STAS domain-containing protein n=1 Tax=Artemisia annua TaxID=35608 RepID=A0A2U1MC50_ARTAN|nr:STAS domain-containing protein [Artemisia annua]